MIVLRIVLGTIGLLAGVAWLGSARAAAQCNSVLGQVVQGVSQQASSQCQTATTFHTLTGLVCGGCLVGLIITFFTERNTHG